MDRKSFKDISWVCSEDEYRADPALSYSTLARYNKVGFDGLEHLFDKIESPSLTFGSCVDALITGGQQEFEDRFMVAEFTDISDSIKQIVDVLFKEFNVTHNSLYSIPDTEIIGFASQFNYQNNWKPETRAKVIREKGEDYYKLLYLSQNKTIISTELYNKVLACVDTLKSSETTKIYFQQDNPFDDTIERLYQLKFKFSINGVDYRSMADLIIVDHYNKIVYPIDLKTSGKPEWNFYKSFVEWNYQIQSRLYWRNIQYNMKQDDYFKDFQLVNYRFIVINKDTLTPLVWEFEQTKAMGTIQINDIEFKDPYEIGEELNNYLKNTPKVPFGIKLNKPNNIVDWLKQM